MTTYRVVQWSTGNIGSRSLRAVIEHPDLELVGLYVHTDEKVGRDAGDPPTTSTSPRAGCAQAASPAPGIRTTVDLPHVIARLGRG